MEEIEGGGGGGGEGIRFLGHEGRRTTGEMGVEPREEGKVGDRGKDGTQHLGVPDKETDVSPIPVHVSPGCGFQVQL